MYRASDIREFSSNFVLSWEIVAVLLSARYMEKKLGEHRVTWMNLLIWSPRTDLCHVTPIAIRNKWPTYFLVNAGCSSNRNTVDKEAILREKKVDNVEWNFSYDDTFPKEPSFEDLSSILRISDKRTFNEIPYFTIPLGSTKNRLLAILIIITSCKRA